ncbi:MAG TPA: lipopolysaccharide heptosyltransferase I [Casimicrobiaceae bacterium]|nr:lipopolysaccharide heptosyltransferase I [Casimicrobiaceae bacterium]
MESVLVVRPSSLGDIVYALAIASDIRRAHPGVVVDWVSEPGFAPLVALCPDVARVVTFGLRRWRRAPLARATWRDVGRFRDELRRTRYTAILDLQEQVKGALIARLARGTRHGFDYASIREPAAALFDDVHHRVSRRLHFLVRCRRLAAAALGHRADDPPRWNLQPQAAAPAMPSRPYAVLLHGTSRDDKLWPETHWRELEQAIAEAGLAIVLPWGSPTEEARSRRLAQGFEDAVVPPWLSLPDAAALFANAALAVGVDTGFTHLAAVLGTPTIAIFSVTDPARHGVACAGPHAHDLGDRGAMPSADAVVGAVRARLAALA